MEYSTDDPHHPSGSGGSCLSDQRRRAPSFVEKEHMFDKVVTPSDVGKLNRLVIPKQHAEKYLPLDASSGEKGRLLSFEDRTGKSWRFRYSYWNSSQSYVMTKGWSRFVKEKCLDAGDTVSFGRGVGEAGRGRLFIDWKRRQDALGLPHLPRFTLPSHNYHHHHYHNHHLETSLTVPFAPSGVPWGRLLWPPSTPAAMAMFDHHRQLGYGYTAAAASNPHFYLRSAGSPVQVAVQLGIGRSGGGGGHGELGMPVILDSVPVVEGGAVAKRVRLFGVNLDCPPTEADSERDSVRDGQPRPPVLPSLQLSAGASEMVNRVAEER